MGRSIGGSSRVYTRRAKGRRRIDGPRRGDAAAAFGLVPRRGGLAVTSE